MLLLNMSNYPCSLNSHWITEWPVKKNTNHTQPCNQKQTEFTNPSTQIRLPLNHTTTLPLWFFLLQPTISGWGPSSKGLFQPVTEAKDLRAPEQGAGTWEAAEMLRWLVGRCRFQYVIFQALCSMVYRYVYIYICYDIGYVCIYIYIHIYIYMYLYGVYILI